MVKPEKKAQIEKDLEQMARKTDWGKPAETGIRTMGMFTLMKKMHEAGWDSSPVEKKYWIEQGWMKEKKVHEI